MLENGDYLTFDQSDYEYEDGEVTALRKVIVNKMNDIFMNFVGACHVSLFKPFFIFFGSKYRVIYNKLIILGILMEILHI